MAFGVPVKFGLPLMNRLNGFEERGSHWQDIVINEG
jgi:hypothetical protein